MCALLCQGLCVTLFPEKPDDMDVTTYIIPPGVLAYYFLPWLKS